jgi:hypothetical protein
LRQQRTSTISKLNVDTAICGLFRYIDREALNGNRSAS